MIGYNPTEINEMRRKIKSSYETLSETLTTGWTKASKVMNANWVGVDERDYEEKLAARLTTLYNETGELVVNAMNNIANVGNAWIKFQNENKMKGGEADEVTIPKGQQYRDPNTGKIKSSNTSTGATGPSSFKLVSIESIKSENFTLNVSEEAFGDKFGIKSGGGTKIKTTLKEYSSEVQSKMKNIYSSIDSGTAFLGKNQAEKIKEYLGHIGELMGKVSTAFGDIYRCVDKLTTSEAEGAGAYEKADTTIASKFTKTMSEENKTSNKFNNVE